MRAAYYERFGPADAVLTVGEIDTPRPAAGEVLVAVAASGVNPSDVKLRAGRRPGGLAPVMPFPRIVPHSDGAGEIVAVGEGVARARIGERVWLWNGQWERAFGTAAERIALPAGQAAPLPQAADFATGARLGIPAMTAHAALFAGLAPARDAAARATRLAGARVLVSGGAGAVGELAVRMARLAGAERVVATASTAAKRAIAETAGAHCVVDYRAPDAEARLAAEAGPRGFDRIVEVDFGANIARNARLVARGGVISAYASMAAPEPVLPFYALMFKDVTLRLPLAYLLDAAVRRSGEADLFAWLAAGALPIRVGAPYPLDAVAAAHAAVEAGAEVGVIVAP